jgi:hypothetical protein
MANESRILWLHFQLKNNRYPSLKSLENKFKISISQAKKDITYMRRVFHAPIKYSRKFGGYYYNKKFDFNPLLTTNIFDWENDIGEVIDIIKTSIKEERVIKVKIDETIDFFHPLYLNLSDFSLFGFSSENNSFKSVSIKEIKEIGYSQREFVFEPLILHKEITNVASLKEAVLSIKDEEKKIHFMNTETLINWSLSQKSLKITGPPELIDEINFRINKLKRLLKEKND